MSKSVFFDSLSHFLNTFWAGAQRVPGPLPHTLPGAPCFSGTLSRALRGSLRARRAEDSSRGSRLSQSLGLSYSAYLFTAQIYIWRLAAALVRFSLCLHRCPAYDNFAKNPVDAEIITNKIPRHIFCVTEVITQIKLIPQETFLCNRLAIARLNHAQ